MVQFEETLHALHDIVQAGHARYVGMSNCAAWQLQLMQREFPAMVRPIVGLADLYLTEYAIHNRLTPFVSMQDHHCAIFREVSVIFPNHQP